jgi:hypothetical protein
MVKIIPPILFLVSGGRFPLKLSIQREKGSVVPEDFRLAKNA